MCSKRENNFSVINTWKNVFLVKEKYLTNQIEATMGNIFLCRLFFAHVRIVVLSVSNEKEKLFREKNAKI